MAFLLSRKTNALATNRFPLVLDSLSATGLSNAPSTPDLGTLAMIETLRSHFYRTRFHLKQYKREPSLKLRAMLRRNVC